jgi:hypothetical protein
VQENMKKKVFSTLLLALLIYLLTGCSRSFTTDDPIPRRALKEIVQIGTTTAYMEEFVGSAVIAEVILRNAAENRGTVGDVCDAVRLVEPGVLEQLALRTAGEISGYPSTTESLQEILDRLSTVKTRLNCDALNHYSE